MNEVTEMKARDGTVLCSHNAEDQWNDFRELWERAEVVSQEELYPSTAALLQTQYTRIFIPGTYSLSLRKAACGVLRLRLVYMQRTSNPVFKIKSSAAVKDWNLKPSRNRGGWRGITEASPAPILRPLPSYALKRYSGGPGQQDLGRNRQDEGPATHTANEQGSRDENSQIPSIAEQHRDASTEEDVAGDADRGTEPYGAELHRQVVEKYPQLKTKTMQNILDQRRSIFRNKRLSPDTINRIRDEISIELGMKESKKAPKKTPTKRDTPSPDRPLSDKENSHQKNTPSPDRPLSDEEKEFHRWYMLYDGADPTLKPRLPKLAYNKKTNEILQKVNNILYQKIARENTIAELHSIIYAAACTVLYLNKQKVGDKGETQTRTPPWEKRLQLKIDQLRSEIGVLTQSGKNPSNKVKKAAARIAQRYVSEENPGVAEILDHLKQKLAAMAKRLRRYRESHLRKHHETQSSPQIKRTFTKT
ncbi:hypothetical protein QE152_g25756 [Popillia japonica]|uniref:Uncharacterized protein n=1 Tax=Popillia japonica TaxID=7064 RepID=A0AAW1K013_POPJA